MTAHAAPPAGPAVTGYRALSDSDITLMNRIKAKERDVADLVTLVRVTSAQGEPQRQCALAVAAFEEAFMRLCRAVAQPDNPFIRTAAPAPAPAAASLPREEAEPVQRALPSALEAAA